MQKILQVTDVHLQADPADSLQGAVIEQRWHSILSHIQAHHLDADLLMLTGDLVHHSGPIAYQRLKRDLDTLGLPAVWIPGNHDDIDQMDQWGSVALNRDAVYLGDWRVVLLDSTALPDGRGSGSLSASELRRLRSELDTQADKYLLLVMHHNPITLGSVWQDAIALRNADQFWPLVETHTHVRGIVFGHVHQQWTLTHKGIPLFSSPAVAPQYKAGCSDVTLEDDPALTGPAYRIYHLQPGGKIASDTVRLVGSVAP